MKKIGESMRYIVIIIGMGLFALGTCLLDSEGKVGTIALIMTIAGLLIASIGVFHTEPLKSKVICITFSPCKVFIK